MEKLVNFLFKFFTVGLWLVLALMLLVIIVVVWQN